MGARWGRRVANRVVHSPKTRVDERHNTAKHRRGKGRERERERESSYYFTPMQHAEEIQLPFKLHNTLNRKLFRLTGEVHWT